MIFEINTDSVNLAENRDLLDVCLNDAPYLTMIDIEMTGGATYRFLKMDKGGYLSAGESFSRYSTEEFYKLIDDGQSKVASIYLSQAEPSSLTKRHEKLLYDLQHQYRGWIVGGHFVCPTDPNNHDKFFLDAHNNFATVSRLQVALAMLKSESYDGFIKKEDGE